MPSRSNQRHNLVVQSHKQSVVIFHHLNYYTYIVRIWGKHIAMKYTETKPFKTLKVLNF